MNAPGRSLIPLLILFFIITIAVYLLDTLLKNNSIDGRVLLGANALFFLASIISFFIQQRGLQNKNPHVFVRTVMGAMMLKMLICIIAVILYVYLSGNSFNKRGVFLALFLYLVYLATEVLVVMKMNKHRKTDV
jgi:hypothetical protein